MKKCLDTASGSLGKQNVEKSIQRVTLFIGKKSIVGVVGSALLPYSIALIFNIHS